MRNLITAVVVVALSIAAACTSEAPAPHSAEPPPPFAITGTLVSDTGTPLANEIVTLAARTDTEVKFSYEMENNETTKLLDPHATTDLQGKFTIRFGPAHVAKIRKDSPEGRVALAAARRSGSGSFPKFVAILTEGAPVDIGLDQFGSEMPEMAIGTVVAQ